MSVVTAAAQARMASREAEKEAVATHMSPPATNKKIGQSTRDTKKYTTTSSESRSPSVTTSHKEDMTSKRSAPKEDSEIPKKKPKGLVEIASSYEYNIANILITYISLNPRV